MDNSVDGVEVATYVHRRIMEMKDKHKITTTKLARIMRYERAALHRLLHRKSCPNMMSMVYLSDHFGVSMNYWFPEVAANPLPVIDKVKLQNLTEGTAELTKRIVETIACLSAVYKYQLLACLNNAPEMLLGALKMLEALCGSGIQLSMLVSALAKIAEQERLKPAPHGTG
jgi:hypothetical protein